MRPGVDFIIRPYREGEAAALWDVFHSSVHGIACRDYAPAQLDAWAPLQVDAAAWAERLQAIRPFVAEAGAKRLGYADLQPDGTIDHFFVAAEAAGAGVGTALMGRIHEAALGQGLPSLHAEVSLTARPFFEKWGFAVETGQTVVKRGVELHNLKMRKYLATAGGSSPGAEVAVVEYDPSWPAQFEAERALLEPILASWLAGPIQHVGSTAVPGLPAKPVIDIMAPVPSLEAARPAIGAVAAAGYCHFPYKAETMHWFCKPSPSHRTHHLHLVPFQSLAWIQRLAFRDALRRDPGLAAQYAALKRDLAVRFRLDREAYTAAKAPFIRQVLGPD